MSAATCSSFIILFMFFANSTNTLIIESTQFQNLNISSLERFAFYYKNHTYMIHSDAFGVMNVAEIVDMLPTYQMVGMNNTLIKPGAKNTVNIFFIQNLSAFLSFSFTLKVFNDDGCNLFLALQTFQEICFLEQVKLAPASYVFNVKNDQLFSCFTENEELGLTLVPMEKFNNLEIYHRSFGDLQGKIMKVYFLNSQAALCRAIENGIVIKVMEGICEPKGAEANLVRVLGKKFNFTPEFWVFEYKNAENMLNEMINSIGRGDAELGIGTITLEDDGLVYYTTFTQISAEFVILFVNPTKQLNLGKILISFDFIVYVIAVVSFILIVILKIVFTNVFSYGVENRHFIIILLKMVVEQGSDLTGQLYSSITMKLLLSLWLYFTIIFCTVLKSQISSILIKPETYDCRSVEDLKRNDFLFAILDRFQHNFNGRYGWMGVNIAPLGVRHFEDVKQICPQTMNFFDLKVALVHSEFDLLVGLKMCMNYFPQHKMNDMKMLKESNIYHALAMNPLSPYKKQFSLNIDRLKSSGILTYWYDYLNENVLKQLTKVHAPPRPFEVNQVFNFFILLMVGLLIGFLVLIMEIIEAALNRRHKINFIIMEKL